MMAWLGAFAFTQVVEIPLYWRFLRAMTSRRRFLIAFGASALTHPVVWFVFPVLVPESYLLMVLLAESFAVGVEALWLKHYGVEQPWLLSLTANALSLGLGLASRALFSWP